MQDTPQYSAQNIMAAWDEIQENNRKRQRIPFILNELAALEDPSFRGSKAYNYNMKHIQSLGQGDRDAFDERMKVLQAEEMTQLQSLMQGRLIDANPRTVGEFDEWIQSQPQWVNADYKTWYDQWEKKADQLNEEDKLTREEGEALKQTRLSETGQTIFNVTMRQFQEQVPPGQQTFTEQEKYRARMVNMAMNAGLPPDQIKDLNTSWDASFGSAPSTKPAIGPDGDLGFYSDRQIAYSQGQIKPIEDDGEKGFSQGMMMSISAVADEMEVTSEEWGHIRQIYNKGAMTYLPMLQKVNPEAYTRIVEIIRQAKFREDWFEKQMSAFGNPFGGTSTGGGGGGGLEIEVLD